MIDNPSSEDLSKLGLVDFHNYVLITDSHETFEKVFEDFYLFMVEPSVQIGEKLTICEFKSQDHIDSMREFLIKKDYGKVKLFESETPVITLNEVLEKINVKGLASLSEREKYFLDKLNYYNK